MTTQTYPPTGTSLERKLVRVLKNVLEALKEPRALDCTQEAVIDCEAHIHHRPARGIKLVRILQREREGEREKCLISTISAPAGFTAATGFLRIEQTVTTAGTWKNDEKGA